LSLPEMPPLGFALETDRNDPAIILELGEP
jgi:hypothetical protein